MRGLENGHHVAIRESRNEGRDVDANGNARLAQPPNGLDAATRGWRVRLDGARYVVIPKCYGDGHADVGLAMEPLQELDIPFDEGALRNEVDWVTIPHANLQT